MSISWALKYLICIGFVLVLAGCGSAADSGGSAGENNDGRALVSWMPPTENTDGSALVDLAGYLIYYGGSPNTYSSNITIDNVGLTSLLVEGLPPSSDLYFVMTAFNTEGIESSYSEEVFISISSN